MIVEDVEEASYTITTCHKSKGLEWDYVKLDEDMLYVDEEQDYNLVDLLKAGQTLNLLYVAITRAKYAVKLPDLVKEVIDQASYLRAEW